MKGFLSTILVGTFILVAIVSAGGDAQSKQDGEQTAKMVIGTVVNTCIVMARATVSVLGGIGDDEAGATDGGADGNPATPE